MRFLSNSLLALFLVTFSITVIAQDPAGPEVTIPGTETRLLFSELVGQE